MADFSSQGSTTGIQEEKTWTPGNLILYSLEDLKGYEFKKFKNKLSDFSYGNKLPIPRGKLENTDCITTKDLLIDTYGQEEAVDVVIEVLAQNGMMGPANDLRERRRKNATLQMSTASSIVQEWKMEYMESVKEEFERFKEHTARRGETVCLQKIYTKLRLIKRSQIMQENEKERLNPDSKNLQIIENRSCDEDEYSSTTIQTLFDPDEDSFIPKVVVLQGPPGIGKTMTSRKIMLEWASGNLYQDKFDNVFHLSCRELNTISRKINLVELLSRTCRLENSDVLKSILKNRRSHKKILFVVDGFDELRCTLEKESEVCQTHDIFEETNTEILLQRLLRKQLLKQCSIIITTRSMALEKLHSFVDKSRHVEIKGFTEEDRKVYFHKLFSNKEDADKALSLIKDNDTLNTMCAVPILCWIVCTVLKPQIKQDIDLLQYQTVTSIYLLYLKGLIKYHGRNHPEQTCLKKLCALAKEGILNQKILFEVEDLKRHGLSLSEVESLFLNEKIFNLDIETPTYYSFIHLSVQEFLAALYYVLDDGPGNSEGTTGSREGTSIPEICKERSLSEMCIKHPHLTLVVRFLFGLLNEKEVLGFSKSTGINISFPPRDEMESWLLGYGLMANFPEEELVDFYCMEVVACLYETQDKDTIMEIFSDSSHLELTGARKGHFWNGENCSKQLCYCLKTCESLLNLSFSAMILDPKYLEMLSSVIHRCQHLSFDRVKFKSGDFPSEDKLIIFTQYDESPDKEIELLLPTTYEIPANLSWLNHSQSNIRTLKIKKCGITASSCNYICSFLRTSKQLTTLDLSDNKLRDSGVKVLCEGLRHAGCNLQELRIGQCSLTSLCCDDLRSLLITQRSLICLDLSTNPFREAGIKLLCEGLRDPACTVQELNISHCCLTSLNCDDLQSVLNANRSLIKLEFSFDFQADPRIKLIYDGFKHSDCTLQELSFDYYRTLKTDTDVEFSEEERCFEDLQHLGYLSLDSTLLDTLSDDGTERKKQYVQVHLYKSDLVDPSTSVKDSESLD